ncbi:MAG: methyltransferase [Cocleimonas sp.]|nr:methyltransferase [Cocleimonas sp.]
MNTIDKHFQTPYGAYQLQRLPLQKKQTLRAWDAADEYLLNYLHQENTLQPDSKLLILNDQFGALATCLNAYTPESWSDSSVSQLSTVHNYHLNQLQPAHHFIPSTETPKGLFTTVLIKIPKTSALLEDQLIKLKEHINADTKIIAAAMTRNIHTSTLMLFENILGTTTTSLAKKKARLIFSHYEKSETEIKSPYPKDYHVKSLGIHLSNHANLFSKDKLDYGSLLMLEQFKKLPQAKHIVDLGCGNGVLGIIAQRYQPQSNISFLDESYMAVASAKMNYDKIYKESRQSEFIVSDCLSQLPDSNVDLILCNPPFHQQHTIGDQIAWRMFTQSAKCLNKGGKLWIVGNQHLHYAAKLKKIFGNSKVIATNNKFQVITATSKR